MADYVIYKYLFQKVAPQELLFRDDNGELVKLSAQQHLDQLLIGPSVLGFNKVEKDGSLTPLSNRIESKHDEIIFLRLCSRKNVTIWKDYEKKKEVNEPFCNIIIDNRPGIAQLAIEKCGAFGTNGPDKVVDIITAFVNKALEPFGYEIVITRKMRTIEVWDMVAERVKMDDPVKSVKFDFHDPRKTEAIDATDKQMQQMTMLLSLAKSMGAVSSIYQMNASQNGSLILDRTQKDIAGMVSLCTNNGWDIEIRFKNFGVYRTNTKQGATFSMPAGALSTFVNGEIQITPEHPQGEFSLIEWLDHVRSITKEYDNEE